MLMPAQNGLKVYDVYVSACPRICVAPLSFCKGGSRTPPSRFARPLLLRGRLNAALQIILTIVEWYISPLRSALPAFPPKLRFPYGSPGRAAGFALARWK